MSNDLVERLRSLGAAQRPHIGDEAADLIESQAVEITRQSQLLSELYQIVAVMADDVGIFEEERVQSLLTEIQEPTGKTFLPWAVLEDKNDDIKPRHRPQLRHYADCDTQYDGKDCTCGVADSIGEQ